MPNDIELVLGKVISRTNRNTERITQQNRQRRGAVVNEFDKEYSAIGQAGVPAQFWLSLSPDYVFIERWEFKILIDNFTMPIASGSDAMTPVTLTIDPINVNVHETSLTTNGTSITPNPHGHETDQIQPQIHPSTHVHEMNKGVTVHPSDISDDFKITLDGIDLTAQFKAQFDGWIEGNGMYPDTTIEHRYDILKACSTLDATTRSNILKQGYHLLEFHNSGVFSAKIRIFDGYNIINRQGDSTGA